MSKILKTSMLFVSIVLLFMLVFLIPSMLIPVSKTLLERLNSEEMKMFFPLLLAVAVYISFTFWLFLNNLKVEKRGKLFLTLSIAFFLMYALMGFLESIFWGDAFKGIETSEFVRILLRFTITFTLFAGYLALIAKMKPRVPNQLLEEFNFKQLGIKLLIISGIYFVLYNLFGYFVAFQFSETRYFYTGSYELNGFFPSMWQNISDPAFVGIHLFRGLLFGIASYLFYSILCCSRIKKIVILSLILGGFGFQIILPNPLFPEMVRISHFIETTSSMMVFGAIAGFVLTCNGMRKPEVSLDNHTGIKTI